MKEDYRKAKKLGERALRLAFIKGQAPHIPALDDYLSQKSNMLQEIPLGVAEIPISMIAGTKTKARSSAFANNFMPLLDENSEFGTKWSRLYDYQTTEGLRDPIEVYEFMNWFYVEEGNKRVSVMKFLGAVSIPAKVTRILPPKNDSVEYRVYEEYQSFYEVTKIMEITFSAEGRYARLAEIMGMDLVNPWPEELIENVVSAFRFFKKVYEEKGGIKLGLTVGDAFLIYLEIFSLESLSESNEKEIGKRLLRIWNEYLTATNHSNNVELVEAPEDIDQGAGFMEIINFTSNYSEKNPLKAAFIYEKNTSNSSWAYNHELGRNAVEAKFPKLVSTEIFWDCADPESQRRAIDDAVANGAELIFTTSSSMMPQTLKAAVAYPEVKFFNCSINFKFNSVRTYYARMFEAKFLMGALAASQTKDHLIGYQADMPIYGSIANINAFAIGAALVDPNVKIYVQWSEKENTDWKKEMKDQGIRVISGPDIVSPENPDKEEYGVYRMEEDGSITKLAAPVLDWGRYYELILIAVLDGSINAKHISRKDQALNLWWGMESGVVDVVLSDNLSYYTRKFMSILRDQVIHGTLSPFDGELHSQTGIVKKAGDPRLSNKDIITMQWLNDNVIGSIPKVDEIVPKSKEIVKAAGVEEAKPIKTAKSVRAEKARESQEGKENGQL